MEKTRYDVIVIGAGAAGMMAAGRAAELGKRVLLIERNKRLGEKLRITGGTRCNIANAEPDERKLLANYKNAEQELQSPFTQFGMKDTFSFFEGKGLPLVVQASNRAFPKSEKAVDVVKTLEAYMAAGGVDVRFGRGVDKISVAGGRVEGVMVGREELKADSYILATGGLSHPETGSTGDGFIWLKGMNHTIEEPTPTIVPLRANAPWIKALSGKSASGAKISFFMNGERRFSKTGNILFTHFGLSGPTILNAAGDVADLLHEGQVSATIDLHPTLDLGILDRHITSVFEANKNKDLKNVFRELVPVGMSDTLLALVPQINPDTKVHSVTKAERRVLAELLKGLPLTIQGLMGFERAVVADGGVPLSEVDMRTMRSGRIRNLFLVGDLLHITRPSGGYSLQLCWTTGFIAGSNA